MLLQIQNQILEYLLVSLPIEIDRRYKGNHSISNVIDKQKLNKKSICEIYLYEHVPEKQENQLKSELHVKPDK